MSLKGRLGEALGEEIGGLLIAGNLTGSTGRIERLPASGVGGVLIHSRYRVYFVLGK